MHASVTIGIGGLEKIQYQSIETPKPKNGETLLKVLYCGVNHLDVLIRQGKRPGPQNFPHILGSEIVGEIVETGEIVCVYPWIFCGTCQQCKLGNENICDNGGTFGRTRWGGYAEYVTVPQKNIAILPENVSLQDAVSTILAGTTAYHLIKRAGVIPNSTVLVTGTTGGVGTAVIQLLKHQNCHIVCATSHPEKKKKLQELGVDRIVATSTMVDEILSFYPQGVEYAIDIVGGSIWSKALETLGKNGTLVFCSTSLEEPGVVHIGKAFNKQVNILGSYGGTKKHMEEVLTLLSQKILSPVIDSIFPLQEAQKAHEKIETQNLFGKILLEPV